jgi:hypothetical protein
MARGVFSLRRLASDCSPDKTQVRSRNGSASPLGSRRFEDAAMGDLPLCQKPRLRLQWRSPTLRLRSRSSLPQSLQPKFYARDHPAWPLPTDCEGPQTALACEVCHRGFRSPPSSISFRLQYSDRTYAPPRGSLSNALTVSRHYVSKCLATSESPKS